MQYPSKSLNKNVGKALAHGVPSRIATAVTNCLLVKKPIILTSPIIIIIIIIINLLLFKKHRKTKLFLFLF